ncbi:hypothetical protein B0I08_105101 [Glaciihabitans tibetensis]|uniref:Uncharacterized protein n=1 Tax=Glaciihabitans tibetensis TaxID=1266600 RepID=A0A2T0VCN7_9MICO|nr:hypothetical protein [Glaciihabitans tibetensis]PRY67940.1 hypothetical protein B0I08_105101 [Glaciihabitans tibetensis]
MNESSDLSGSSDLTGSSDLSPERRAAMRGWVLDYVDRRQRRKRRLTVVGAGAVVLTTLSAAGWVVVASQHVQERQVFCYAEPSLSAEIAEGERFSGDALGDPREYAVAMCAELWRVGVLGQTTPSTPPAGPAGFAVPELTLCVRADMSLAVFPDAPDDFCVGAGLGE